MTGRMVKLQTALETEEVKFRTTESASLEEGQRVASKGMRPEPNQGILRGNEVAVSEVGAV